MELASFGLVELMPNRGTVVQPFGPQEIREISQIRAIAGGARRPDVHVGVCHPPTCSAVEEQIYDNLRCSPETKHGTRVARAVNTQLHGLIADHCGSRRLAAEIGRYLLLFRALPTFPTSAMPGRTTPF